MSVLIYVVPSENFPAETDVRAGVPYAGDTMVGTLDLPAISDVRQGVVFDNDQQTGEFAPEVSHIF